MKDLAIRQCFPARRGRRGIGYTTASYSCVVFVRPLFLNKQEKLPFVEEELQAFKGAEESGFQAVVGSNSSYRTSC